MKLSHSKLGTILSCPMTYYLGYIEGIAKKDEKPALAIGSAVHWGIEHDTEDLTEYFIKNGTVKSRDNYTRDQLLAEAMVHGYRKHKDEIFEEMLTNNETGEKYELLEETHELYVTGELPCAISDEPHKFVGIVDLLLLTNKGFIVIDYKTSSYAPNWNSYLDQIYRYIFMLNTMFPDVPIIKIGIINLRKTGIRQKKTENESQFLNRMKFEYDVNDENYVNYHEYEVSALNQQLVDDYTTNLAKQCDLAHMIDEKGIRFINFAAAEGTYGKSDFWDIFYRTPDAHVLYSIRDKVWNEDEQKFDARRDCRPIDMKLIDGKCFNHYEYFEEIVSKHQINVALDYFLDEVKEAIKEEGYDFVDDDLLVLYDETYRKIHSC